VAGGAAGGVGGGGTRVSQKIINPDRAILPVLRLDATKGTIKDILGTAFFFSRRPILLSVAHVLCVAPGANELIAVPCLPPSALRPAELLEHHLVAPLMNVRRHPTHHLAVADVPGVTRFEHFSLRNADPPAGVPSVLTYDYVSRITSEAASPGAQPLLTMRAYVWKGYVHAILEAQDPPMSARATVLEASIPVIRGMSGAPLVDEQTLQVIGVLFNNRRRALDPAPQATDDAQAWYLPIGQALHWSHARDFLRDIGADADE
jgi:Trypsin-like peptidase domain